MINRNTPRFADIKLENGVRLRYAEQGNKEGLPVILLHGYSDSSFSYSRVMPLMDARYRVFALDQRGHGESDRPVSGYKFADFASDVLAFMDAKNLSKAIIVGHSMGSFVAQHIALSVPKRIEKLILIGSATTIHNNAVLDLQKEVDDLEDPVPIDFIREFQYGTAFQKLPEDFMNRIIAESLKLPANVWHEAMKGMLAADSKSELGKIKVPTLILWGEKDSIFPRSEQDALLSAIPDSALKVYEKVGHNPHWEKPKLFVKDVEKFLNGGN